MERMPSVRDGGVGFKVALRGRSRIRPYLRKAKGSAEFIRHDPFGITDRGEEERGPSDLSDPSPRQGPRPVP